MLMLEVYYKKDPHGPMDLARVLYGPFAGREELDGFFETGVAKNVFNPNHKMIRFVNSPSYDPVFKES